MGSLSVDDLRASSIRTCADEDISSIKTFVAGMKEMVKQKYEKQLVDSQVRISRFSYFRKYY